MTRVVGLLLFGLLVACGSKAGEDAVDEKATQGFARALAAAASADPTQSAALLARGAFETVAPSMKCFERFGGAATGRARVEALFDCGLACTPDAVQSLKGKEPRTWMAGLSAACGPEHFAIDEAEAALLSPEWFLVHKIGEFAARHAKAARGGSKASLDRAMAGFKLALPLPALAAGLYELAVAPEAVSVPIATRTYVVVPASGPLRVGASPYATLQAIGAAIETPDKRAGFPGNEATAADLPDRVLEAAGAEPEGARAVADALNKNPAMLQSPSGTSGLPSGLHGEVRQALRGDLASDGAPVPLLLADGGRPASEVIEIAAELDRVLLAVASPDDPAARALLVELDSVLNSMGRGPGQAHVALAPGGLEAAKKTAGGSEQTVVIRAEGQVPWRDAVAVAAVAVARGCKRVIFTSEKLDDSKGGGGARGGR